MNLSEKVVLIVDDTAFLRNSLIHQLEDIGFSLGHILTAENGKEALDLLKAAQEKNESAIDLILCDWNMPKMTGLQLLQRIRQSNDRYNMIPFALVTTVSEKDKIIEALSYKLSGYIIKPVEKNKLLALIHSVFGE